VCWLNHLHVRDAGSPVCPAMSAHNCIVVDCSLARRGMAPEVRSLSGSLLPAHICGHARPQFGASVVENCTFERPPSFLDESCVRGFVA
jgi:hypothetical protein